MLDAHAARVRPRARSSPPLPPYPSPLPVPRPPPPTAPPRSSTPPGSDQSGIFLDTTIRKIASRQRSCASAIFCPRSRPGFTLGVPPCITLDA